MSGRSEATQDDGTTVEDEPIDDLRLFPLVLGSWLGAWVGTSERVSWALSVAVALGLVVAAQLAGRGRVWRHLALAATLAALAVLAGSTLRVAALRSGPVTGLAESRATVAVDLVPRIDPRRSLKAGGGTVWFRADVVRISGRGTTADLRRPVTVIVSGAAAEQWLTVPVGGIYAGTGRLAPAGPGSDVAALVRITGPPQQVAAASAGQRLVERVRQGLRDAVAGRRPDQAALVPALVVGDTSRMTADLQTDFQTTGLTHLTAVSGANLTLLLAFLVGAARWVGVRGWWLRGVAVIGVVVFIALCRTEPSVLRAAAMGVVGLVALGSGGSGRAALRQLSLACSALLLVDPWLSRSAGMALSALACAGIIWWSPRWAARMAWAPSWLGPLVTVPLAAQLATQPVVTGLSGSISWAAVAANLLAGPFVGPTTVLGFAAAGASLVHPALATVLGFAAAWSVQPIVLIARAGAELPGASSGWPVGGASVALLVLACLLLVRLVPWVLARWWASGLVSIATAVTLLVPVAPPGWPPRDWLVVACDVGQGDALVVNAGGGSAVVVDTGPDPSAVRRCLGQLRVRSVDLLVLTHFHDDHTGGLAGVLSAAEVQQVLVSPLAQPATEAAAVAAALGSIPSQVSTPGDQWHVGDVRWQTLGPDPQWLARVSDGASEAAEVESGAQNDASLVGLVQVRGVRILFTGDVEPDGQQQLLRTYGPIEADILKVPHHGSSRQDERFIRGTGAVIAIASAGQDNEYGHPASKTVGLVESAGMRILRTDQQGAVAVSLTREGMRLHALGHR